MAQLTRNNVPEEDIAQVMRLGSFRSHFISSRSKGLYLSLAVGPCVSSVIVRVYRGSRGYQYIFFCYCEILTAELED